MLYLICGRPGEGRLTVKKRLEDEGFATPIETTTCPVQDPDDSLLRIVSDKRAEVEILGCEALGLSYAGDYPWYIQDADLMCADICLAEPDLVHEAANRLNQSAQKFAIIYCMVEDADDEARLYETDGLGRPVPNIMEEYEELESMLRVRDNNRIIFDALPLSLALIRTVRDLSDSTLDAIVKEMRETEEVENC